jgi:hypothetical protein
LAKPFLHNGAVQMLFAGEVVEQRSLLDTYALGDKVEAGPIVTTLAEKGFGHLQDALTCAAFDIGCHGYLAIYQAVGWSVPDPSDLGMM